MPSPLISPADVRERIGRPGVVLIDARPSDADYQAGHIAGAVHASLERHLSTASEAAFDPRSGGRHPLPPIERWAAQLGAWGIGPQTAVVIYDAADASNAAARAWWMLRAVGHEDVRVIDGGLAAARAEGLPLTTDSPRSVPRGRYPVGEWKLPLVSMEFVDRVRLNPDWKVLDVRSTPRYRGETEPIDPVAGHIPGAVNLPFTENMSGDRFKTSVELREEYERLLGGTPADHLVVHCGSGVTACHTLLALESAGLRGAALYVGSWSEWCRSEALPRAASGETTPR